MSVQNLDAAGPAGCGESPGDAPIETRTTIETKNRHALRLQFLTQRADGVEAEHRRLDATAETANRLRDEHLGTGHLHDVDHETHPDRG